MSKDVLRGASFGFFGGFDPAPPDRAGLIRGDPSASWEVSPAPPRSGAA